MRKYLITLENRASGAKFTVQVSNRRGHAIWTIHEQVLKANPGCFIRKSKLL